MKTFFIINPKAGTGKKVEELVATIKENVNRLKADASIYITKAVGDAEKFVRKQCQSGGPARFIACGGDGTLGEVLNGAIEIDGSEIGVMPFGTGNDFCRNFKESAEFFDVQSQIEGECIRCDAMKYSTQLQEGTKTRYCANMFNIGFDCNVADMTGKMKMKPFVSGSLAYYLSILVTLIKKNGAKLKIELDGIKKHSGTLLLTSIANGRFCGGGIKSNPLASVHDGFLDVNIIKNISRTNFLTKLPFYMKGTHIRLRGIEKVIASEKCKRATIEPLGGKMRLCVDGEIVDAKKTEFEIVPNAFAFVIPSKRAETMTEETEVVLV